MKKLSNNFSIKIICAIIALFVALTAIVAVAPTNVAHAGLTSSFYLESSGFNGELSRGTFSFTNNDDVSIDSDNIIYFGQNDANQNTSTKLMLRAKLNQLTDIGNDFATISMSFDIIDIPNNGAFKFAMALPKNNSDFGATGSIEFDITKSGSDYVLGVYQYGTSIKTLASNLSVGSVANLVIDINLDGSLQIAEDERVLTVVNIGNTMPEGYIAFGYSGAKCKVNMTSIVIAVADYDTPTNPGTIVEKFDNNEFNANLWWSEAKTGAKSPSICHVENNYLRISGAHKPHFTSLYEYSNLSLEFDFFDYACYTVDEDGNATEYSSESMTVYIGISNYKEDIYSSIINKASLKVTIGGTNVAAGRAVDMVHSNISISNSGQSISKSMTDVNPCDKVLSAGRRTNVKIEVIDMTAKVWIKYEDSSSYGEPILEMALRNQPTGYVRFGCYGDTGVMNGNEWHRTLVPNYSLDNITLKNLDQSAEICDMPAFKSNLYDMGDDWPYVNKDRDTDLLVNRLDQSVSGQTGCAGSIVTASAVLPTLVGMALVIKRRKNRNEEE